MPIKIHDVFQGSDEWLALRCGTLTASEMKHIITPKTMKYAGNDKCRAHAYEIAAQRITGFVEPMYIGDDMMRGMADEPLAIMEYQARFPERKVGSVGFITNDDLGFTLGYSPDALVDDDGALEAKSRRIKFQVQTFVEDVAPDDFMIQMQTGMIVKRLNWCDFISYSGGLPMFVKRVLPDLALQEAIIAAATAFEADVRRIVADFRDKSANLRFTPRTPTEISL